ncbi:MAG: penicillin-binding protein activator LpoB, partial [Bacteroidaceae bacterium]|nr:penicillin-binding protein activator LpoB [Bacteroidaceae bacterium]
GGDTPETEYSIVDLSEGAQLGEDISKYIIQEIK